MDYEEYSEILERKLQRHFDMERNFVHRNNEIDLFAKYFERNERYIATKKATIYAIENNEYCFVKRFQPFNKEKIDGYTTFLKTSIDDFVTPHSDHMSTVLTGVMVIQENCEDELKDMVKKFKFHKSFAFGFKGWVDIRLILVILDNGEVITNKKGKEVERVYKIV